MTDLAARIEANKCVMSADDTRIMWARLSLYGYNSPQDYKRSDAWRRIREEMKVELPLLCQVCGTTKRLCLHHKTYTSICAETPDDLAWVCSACHFLPGLHVLDKSFRLRFTEKRRKPNVRRRAVRHCSEPGCGRRHFGKGFCAAHYYVHVQRPKLVTA